MNFYGLLLLLFFGKFLWNKRALSGILLHPPSDDLLADDSGSGKGNKEGGNHPELLLKAEIKIERSEVFLFFCAKSPSKDPRHAPVSNDFSHASISCRHKTPPRRSLRHKKKTLKNVSRLTPRDERRGKKSVRNKEPGRWLMFLSLLSPSPLVSFNMLISSDSSTALFFRVIFY